MVPNKYLHTCASLGELTRSQASLMAPLCIIGTVTALPRPLSPELGPSQDVPQHHVHVYSLRLLCRGLFCERRSPVSRLETSVIFPIAPPPSPHPTPSIIRPCHFPAQSLLPVQPLLLTAAALHWGLPAI